MTSLQLRVGFSGENKCQPSRIFNSPGLEIVPVALGACVVQLCQTFCSAVPITDLELVTYKGYDKELGLHASTTIGHLLRPAVGR